MDIEEMMMDFILHKANDEQIEQLPHSSVSLS